MAEMERQFPGSREKSVFASVELSLRRMSQANRQRARVLGVFHGGVHLVALRQMMEWRAEDVAALAVELVATGLATPDPYNHLTLNPALCPYLRAGMAVAQREELTSRWVAAMRAYVEYLTKEQGRNTEVAATLTVLELPNLFVLLDLVQCAGDPQATIGLTTVLYTLLRWAGRPRLLEQVGQVRDTALAVLGDAWSHARFEAARTRSEQQLAAGRLRDALEGAQKLLERARAAGERAYPDAGYDLALACTLLGRVLTVAGGSEQALPLLDEARQRFDAVEECGPGREAARMVAVCLMDQGICLRDLGRLDEAVATYEESICRADQFGDDRQVAVGELQLGAVRLLQRRYEEALAAHEEARERFMRLDEPRSVSVCWHRTGIAFQEAGQARAAEDAYRRSLAISVRLGDVAGQASTLLQLGNLYDVLDRVEEAVAFYRRAADKYVQIDDVANEGRLRSNLGETLRKQRRFAEARREIHRAIECNAQFGHASEPWKTWGILAEIETEAGNPTDGEEARRKAIACYLVYRRGGGENHFPDGRIALNVTQALLAGDPDAASTLLQKLAAESRAVALHPFIRALQSIVAGSRDSTLADASDLHYTMVAEILLLIETLGTLADTSLAQRIPSPGR